MEGTSFSCLPHKGAGYAQGQGHQLGPSWLAGVWLPVAEYGGGKPTLEILAPILEILDLAGGK